MDIQEMVVQEHIPVLRFAYNKPGSSSCISSKYDLP